MPRRRTRPARQAPPGTCRSLPEARAARRPPAARPAQVARRAVPAGRPRARAELPHHVDVPVLVEGQNRHRTAVADDLALVGVAVVKLHRLDMQLDHTPVVDLFAVNNLLIGHRVAVPPIVSTKRRGCRWALAASRVYQIAAALALRDADLLPDLDRGRVGDVVVACQFV